VNALGGKDNVDLLFSNSFLDQISDGGGLRLGDKEFKDKLINVIDGGGRARAVFEQTSKFIRSELSSLRQSKNRYEVQKSIREADLAQIVDRHNSTNELASSLKREIDGSNAEGIDSLNAKLETIRDNINDYNILLEGARVKTMLRSQMKEKRLRMIESKICPSCNQTIPEGTIHEHEVDDGDEFENDEIVDTTTIETKLAFEKGELGKVNSLVEKNRQLNERQSRYVASARAVRLKTRKPGDERSEATNIMLRCSSFPSFAPNR